MPPTIETARLVLRPYADADIDVAYEVLEGHPDVWRFDPGYARSYEQRAALVRRYGADNQEDGEGTLAVALRDSGRFIGHVGLQLYLLPWEPFTTPEVELYYKLGRDYWGHGYAEEACRAMIAFAFDRMRLLRLVTITQPANQRSMRLLERLGFCVGPGPEKWTPYVAAVLTHPDLAPHASSED